jgi:sec-independent protein translocase protein TatA
MSLGPTEIILIVAVVLLLFGGRKIPELMRGLGQGMREFKKASRAGDEDVVEKTAIDSKNKE